MDDTVDITDLVDTMRESFVKWGEEYAVNAAILSPGFGWLALPVVNLFFRGIVKWVLNIVAKSLIMEAFFLNTSVRKASQASDYVNAVNKRKLIKYGDASYEKAEQDEIKAFNNFVRVTS
jgi:hypothetical protein